MTRYPTLFQQKTLWNAATGISILVIGALLVGLIWLMGAVFGFLQPVLIPLIVAGIIAYVLDPVVRFLETRGMSRLWAVITLFLSILLAVTLLVAAVLPGIQRGRMARCGTFFPRLPPPANPRFRAAATPDDGTEHLAPTLARSLHDLRVRHRNGPVGWLLTEMDDQGNPLPPEQQSADLESLDPFARTRGGRMLVENLDVIFKTGRSWLTAGSTKVLGIPRAASSA